MDRLSSNREVPDRPMKYALYGLSVACILLFTSPFFIRGERGVAWVSATLAGIVFVSGVVAVPGRSPWRFVVAIVSVICSAIFAIVAYVFFVEW